MNFIRNRNFRAGPQTSLEGFICPQNSDKQQKIKVFGRSGGGNICFFRYDFLVLGVSFVGTATPCLYFLTFPDSIQAQNLCKSLAGVSWFKVCGLSTG